MNKKIPFPRELTRHPFRDLDREFTAILLLVMTVLSVFFWQQSLMPLEEPSLEDIRNYTERIHYRVIAPPIPKPADIPDKSQTKNQANNLALLDPADTQPDKISEPKPTHPPQNKKVVSERDKRNRRRENRENRKSGQEAKLNSVREKMGKLPILSAATSVGKSSKAKAEAYGLENSGTDNPDMHQFKGYAGSSEQIRQEKKKRRMVGVHDDVTFEVSGESEIPEFTGELNMENTTTELDRSSFYTRGNERDSKQVRSSTSISEVILANQNQVKYCYWTQKRLDSNLRGRIVVEFTIKPDGSVTRVRFRESDWSNKALGKKVEQRITNTIQSWRFPKISPSSGNVTAGATYIFE